VILDYPLRRHHARITFSEPVTGAVTASHDVHILDLSLGGARVEHTIILRPGSNCYLRMPLNDQVVTVNCRVIWSRAVERGPGKQGDGPHFPQWGAVRCPGAGSPGPARGVPSGPGRMSPECGSRPPGRSGGASGGETRPPRTLHHSRPLPDLPRRLPPDPWFAPWPSWAPDPAARRELLRRETVQIWQGFRRLGACSPHSWGMAAGFATESAGRGMEAAGFPGPEFRVFRLTSLSTLWYKTGMGSCR
jgi:hypothetical protein